MPEDEVELEEVEEVQVPEEPAPIEEEIEGEVEEEAKPKDEDRKKFGERARKRINKLVRVRDELREQVAKLSAEKEELQKRYATDSVTAEEHAAAQHEQRIEAEEKRLKAEFLAAEEAAEVDRKYEIMRAQARLEAERLALNTWKAQRQKIKPPEQVEKRPPSPPVRPKVDPQAQEWFQENTWFTRDQELTKVALDIDRDLQSEGYDPFEAPEPGQKFNDYYSELNARLKRKVTPTSVPKLQGTAMVAPGTRNSGARTKQSVTLTPSERRRASALGVSEEAYAAEKLKMMQRGEL